MDSFVYDIEDTILIEEMKASICHTYICFPHLFHVTNLLFGIHTTYWQLSAGKYISIPLPAISSTFIITQFLFHTAFATG